MLQALQLAFSAPMLIGAEMVAEVSWVIGWENEMAVNTAIIVPVAFATQPFGSRCVAERVDEPLQNPADTGLDAAFNLRMMW